MGVFIEQGVDGWEGQDVVVGLVLIDDFGGQCVVQQFQQCCVVGGEGLNSDSVIKGCNVQCVIDQQQVF